MAKHFTKAAMSNFYAGMGNSLKRPRYSKGKSRSVAEAIAAARNAAMREAARKRK